MTQPISWSTLYRHRRQAAAQFGKIFSLPIRKRVRDVLAEQVQPGQSVLEVGGGDRSMGQFLKQRLDQIRYESLDPDPAGAHDYRSLDDVERQFDCVFAFEVIEHLPLEEIMAWLPRLRLLLVPHGRLVLSTPNTFYPPAYLRDATHCTPLCYDELAGLVAAAGFEVLQIVRIYNDPLPRMLLRRFVFGWLFRLIGIDFARQIVLVARNRPLSETAHRDAKG
jgi:hypothetical protein